MFCLCSVIVQGIQGAIESDIEGLKYQLTSFRERFQKGKGWYFSKRYQHYFNLPTPPPPRFGYLPFGEYAMFSLIDTHTLRGS